MVMQSTNLVTAAVEAVWAARRCRGYKTTKTARQKVQNKQPATADVRIKTI